MLSSLHQFLKNRRDRITQRAFDKVLSQGLYGKSNFMCFILARTNNALTNTECRVATKSIKRYLGHHKMLAAALRDNDLPFTYKDRLAIYRDWKNRPDIVKKVTHKKMKGRVCYDYHI